MKKVWVNGRRLTLAPDQLLQSGGEGIVFGDGRWAYKLFHDPDSLREAKLTYLVRDEIRDRLPDGLLAPNALLTNREQEVIGYRMALLPQGAQPFKALSVPGANGTMEMADTMALLQTVQETLTRLHSLGLVVGDLSDLNLFFHRRGREVTAYWIDVDSYQFAGYPCPVALQPFLDPALYGISDFSKRPCFTPYTDWYAFAVLLVKSLLQVHPYGGTHTEYQTIAARATARLTVFDDTVVYPKNARPPAALSDELLDYVERVFGSDHRGPPPTGLLKSDAGKLARCPRCALSYPGARGTCPGCSRHQAVPRAPAARQTTGPRCLFRSQGIIESLFTRPDGTIILVSRSGSEYRLQRGSVDGQFASTHLFTGEAGYRFGLFGETLVVNLAGSSQLLLLDIARAIPQRRSMLSSDTFRGQAVLATTNDHLFRAANGYLLRGGFGNGLFAEEIAGTLHRNQTQIWGASEERLVAGYARILDQQQLFVLDKRGRVVGVPFPADGPAPDSVIDIAAYFSAGMVAFVWQARRQGQLGSATLVVDRRGRQNFFRLSSASRPPFDTVSGKALLGGALYHPLDDGLLRESAHGLTHVPHSKGTLDRSCRLHRHPAGLLICRADALYLDPAP